MTELHLARNRLEQLPSSLGETLPMLKVLDVSYNSLTKLPDSLGKLKHLENLNARFNQVSAPAENTGFSQWDVWS